MERRTAGAHPARVIGVGASAGGVDESLVIEALGTREHGPHALDLRAEAAE